MNENAMPVKKNCVNCQSMDCSVNEQKHFDGLQVTVVEQHDQALVDARMLGVSSSADSRQTTAKSSGISTKKQSDYWLKRFMRSFDKLSTIIPHRPRAATPLACASESHALASALEERARSNSY